jgi:hypothetical protein
MFLSNEITRRKVQIIPISTLHYRLPEILPSTAEDRSPWRVPPRIQPELLGEAVCLICAYNSSAVNFRVFAAKLNQLGVKYLRG